MASRSMAGDEHTRRRSRLNGARARTGSEPRPLRARARHRRRLEHRPARPPGPRRSGAISDGLAAAGRRPGMVLQARGSGRGVQAAARGPGVCEPLVPALPVIVVDGGRRPRAPANRERGVYQSPGDGGRAVIGSRRRARSPARSAAPPNEPEERAAISALGLGRRSISERSHVVAPVVGSIPRAGPAAIESCLREAGRRPPPLAAPGSGRAPTRHGRRVPGRRSHTGRWGARLEKREAEPRPRGRKPRPMPGPARSTANSQQANLAQATGPACRLSTDASRIISPS